MTKAQLRVQAEALAAKRARLGLSLRRAAEEARISTTTLFRAEAADPRQSAATIAALQAWLLTPERKAA